MKTSAPVHVDRLARALKREGVNLKRNQIIEIAASAFGYHNSNEFQAAARRGDLAPPIGQSVGTVTTSDGTLLVVIRDGTANADYALSAAAIQDGRIGSIGVSPYGGMLALDVDTSSLKASVPEQLSRHVSGSHANGRQVSIDIDVLGTLIEAADGHGDTLRDDLKDDDLSVEHQESNSSFLESIEYALVTARAASSNAATGVGSEWTGSLAEDFRVVHKDVLSLLTDAARSHAEDATTGVEDGIYDQADNDWVAPLEQAIKVAQIARAPQDEESADAAVTPTGRMLYAILRTPHHDEVRFALTQAELDRRIADYCRDAWGSLAGTPLDAINPWLMPDDQVIEAFYGQHAESDEPAPTLVRDEDTVSIETANMLRDMAITTLPDIGFHPASDSTTSSDDAGSEATAPDEPTWLTDDEGDVIYGVTRERLKSLGLDYEPGDSDNDWMPLTEKEFSRVQPGAYSLPVAGTVHRNLLNTPDANGIEVKVGQSCLWNGRKWIVPMIAFDIDEAGREEAMYALHAYAGRLRTLLDCIDGEIRIRLDATDYAHELDVFIPMDVALQFQGSEDWAAALAWLLSPADQRDRISCVTATVRGALGYQASWDATFDVLQEGRAKMAGYLFGEQDDDLTETLAASPFAHKDAYQLWNEGWPLELDTDALKKLYAMK